MWRRGWGALITLSLVCGGTLWSVYSTSQRRANTPTRDDWNEAARYVQTHWREGDRVTWYPAWTGEVRLSLHGLKPLLLPHQGEIDVGRAKRLWVLSAFGYRGRELIDGDKLQSLQPLHLISEHLIAPGEGEVTVSLLEVQEGRVTHDALEDLSHRDLVQVIRSSPSKSKRGGVGRERCDTWAFEGWHCSKSRRASKRLTQCLNRPLTEKLKRRSKRRDLYTLDRRRWLPYVDCGLNPTEHVTRDWRVIEGEPRRCIWFAPHRGREVNILWTPQASEGEESSNSSELWLSWGWEDLAVRHPFRASRARDLELSLVRGGVTLWEQTINPLRAWRRVRLPLEIRPVMGPPAPLTLSVKAPEGVADAALCVDLTIRQPLSPSVKR